MRLKPYIKNDRVVFECPKALVKWASLNYISQWCPLYAIASVGSLELINNGAVVGKYCQALKWILANEIMPRVVRSQLKVLLVKLDKWVDETSD